MLVYRFGKEALDTHHTSYVEMYRAKGRLQHSIAQDFQVIHLDSGYWNLEEDESSACKTVAKLRSVCWFDVRGLVKGVPGGVLRVVWRLSIDRQVFGLNNLEFGCNVNGTNVLSVTLAEECFRLVANAGWIEYTLAEPLVLDTASFADVECYIQDHTDYWKSGIALDYVRIYQE